MEKQKPVDTSFAKGACHAKTPRRQVKENQIGKEMEPAAVKVFQELVLGLLDTVYEVMLKEDDLCGLAAWREQCLQRRPGLCGKPVPQHGWPLKLYKQQYPSRSTPCYFTRNHPRATTRHHSPPLQ
jgi:hypothetical protein